MTITRMLIAFCVTSLITACAAREPITPEIKLARKNAYYFNKGQTYFSRGCYAKALKYLEDAHERYTVADSAVGIADSLNSLANVYLRTGDHKSALLLYDQAIDAYERIGNLNGQVRAQCNKAAALISSGRLVEAAAVLDQADAGHAPELAALRLKTRALLMIEQGKTANARRTLNKALSQTDETRSSVRADILYTLGHLVITDQPGLACNYLNQALDLDHQAMNYAQSAKDLKALGICSSAQGKHRQALDYFERSAKIFALMGDEDQIASIMPLLEKSADETHTDIQAVKYYVSLWLNGQANSNLCK